MNATGPAVVDAIADRAGVGRAFAHQTTRQLRQRGHVPSRRGPVSPQITSQQLALLIVAASLGPGVQLACERALSLPPELLNYLTDLIETAWSSPDDPRFEFGKLRVDLKTGSAQVLEIINGELTTTDYGPPLQTNSVIRSISFDTIRDIVSSIRASRKRRIIY